MRTQFQSITNSFFSALIGIDVPIATKRRLSELITRTVSSRSELGCGPGGSKTSLSEHRVAERWMLPYQDPGFYFIIFSSLHVPIRHNSETQVLFCPSAIFQKFLHQSCARSKRRPEIVSNIEKKVPHPSRRELLKLRN